MPCARVNGLAVQTNLCAARISSSNRFYDKVYVDDLDNDHCSTACAF